MPDPFKSNLISQIPSSAPSKATLEALKLSGWLGLSEEDEMAEKKRLAIEAAAKVRGTPISPVSSHATPTSTPPPGIMVNPTPWRPGTQADVFLAEPKMASSHEADDPYSLNPSPSASNYHPPMTSVPSMLGAITSAPGALTGGAIGAGMDNTSIPKALFEQSKNIGHALYQPYSEQDLTTPSREIGARTGEMNPIEAFITDLVLDPTNLIGGEGTHMLAAAAPMFGAGGKALGKGKMYSRLMEAVTHALPERFFAPQVENILKKGLAGGEEFAYRKVPEFLEAQGPKQIQKQALIDHLTQNREPQLNVKVLGETAKPDFQAISSSELARLSPEEQNNYYDALNAALAHPFNPNPTRHAKWTLAHGDPEAAEAFNPKIQELQSQMAEVNAARQKAYVNQDNLAYRQADARYDKLQEEIDAVKAHQRALSLRPSSPSDPPPGYRENLIQLQRPYPKQIDLHEFNNWYRKRYGNTTGAAQELADGLMDMSDTSGMRPMNPTMQRFLEETKGMPEDFTNTSHYDEPNIITAPRTSDRELPGIGKGTLLEEVQSDWHQKARDWVQKMMKKGKRAVKAEAANAQYEQDLQAFKDKQASYPTEAPPGFVQPNTAQIREFQRLNPTLTAGDPETELFLFGYVSPRADPPLHIPRPQAPEGPSAHFFAEAKRGGYKRADDPTAMAVDVASLESDRAYKALTDVIGYSDYDPIHQLPEKAKIWIQANPEYAAEVQPLLDNYNVTLSNTRKVQDSYINARGKVPDAPFKESWPDLALKHHLLEAAHDPDKNWVGWMGGDVQNDRYGLRQHIDQISYDGANHLQVTDLNGRTLVDDYVDPDNLDQFIPGELADRLVNRPVTPGTGGLRILSEDGLEMGGKGMREFYDNELVRKLEKIAKMFGGKVEEMSLPTITGRPPFDQGEPNSARAKGYMIRLTPEIKAWLIKNGLPLMAVGGVAAGATLPDAQADPRGMQ